MEKKELSAGQLKAIAALLATRTVEEAAKRAKVSRSTLFDWLKLERFKERLKEERETLFDEGIGALKAATRTASAKLIALLNSRNENVRRLTAKEIIGVSLKIAEVQDLEERVSKLEEMLAEKHGPR